MENQAGGGVYGVALFRAARAQNLRAFPDGARLHGGKAFSRRTLVPVNAGLGFQPQRSMAVAHPS